MSFSSYDVGGSHGDSFQLSFLLRTLKLDGLLFQLRSPFGGEVYFSVYLGMGRVFVSSLPMSAPLTAPIFVTNGEKQLLQVEVQKQQVIFEHAGLRYRIGEIPEVNVVPGDQAYVGGLPGDWDSGPWGGHFKGCLQDLRLDSVHLDVDAWNSSDKDNVYFPSDAEHVQRGCISDDTCKVGNTLHNT